jgi:hypothetical protein
MSGSVLENAAAIDVGIILGSKHKALAAEAIRLGGACTKKFAQGDLKMTQGLGSIYKPYGWGGVCFAMTITWISFHAREADFWGWLYGQDEISKTPYGPIAPNRGRMITGLQGALKGKSEHSEGLRTTTDLDMDWRELATAWLLQDGLKKISYGNVQEGPVGSAPALALKVSPDTYKIGGCYREFVWSRSSGRGSHACAAWVGSDVTYFDPNYGEYWIPNASDFRTWFAFYWNKVYAAKYDQYYANSYSVKLR